MLSIGAFAECGARSLASVEGCVTPRRFHDYARPADRG